MPREDPASPLLRREGDGSPVEAVGRDAVLIVSGFAVFAPVGSWPER
jgi:hypothetical protein